MYSSLKTCDRRKRFASGENVGVGDSCVNSSLQPKRFSARKCQSGQEEPVSFAEFTVRFALNYTRRLVHLETNTRLAGGIAVSQSGEMCTLNRQMKLLGLHLIFLLNPLSISQLFKELLI